MTTLRITVEDEQADLLKKVLQEISFVKSVEENKADEIKDEESESAYNRIKKLQDQAKGKDLFKEITDPSEWQRELRKEWDRDF